MLQLLQTRQLYSQVKHLWHLLGRKLGGPESQSLRLEKRNRLPLCRIEQSFIAHPNRSIFSLPTVLSVEERAVVLCYFRILHVLEYAVRV